MRVWGITDTGLVRKENQDACGIRENLPGGFTVCVVCDGMGGAAGGQLASSIAVSVYMKTVEEALTEGMSPAQLEQVSAAAVTQANQAIRDEAVRRPECDGMGTTLVAAIVCGEQVSICNVGDSRAYHVTEAGITRITRDHSWVASMIERGSLTEEEARHHPRRNLITRALGPDPALECDSFSCSLLPGEYLLLCSDGLVNTVRDEEMRTEILRREDESCLERLLALSRSRGAPDNVTAVLLRQ